MKCTVPGCEGEAFDTLNPVCKKCAEDGWTANFEEMSQLVANDPLLAGKIDIVSPMQPKDL